MEAIQTDPDALFNRGNQLDDEGRYDEAIEAYRQSASISGERGRVPQDVLLNLGFSLRSAGRCLEASETWREALNQELVSHGGQGADSHVLRQRAVLLASGRVDFAASEKMAKALRMLNAFGLGSVLPEGATGNELHRLRFEEWSSMADGSVSFARVLAGLLCVGEAWPKAAVDALGNSVGALIEVGLLEEVLPGFLVANMQVYPFQGFLLLTDWPSVTVGPAEPVMAIGTDSLELCLALGKFDGLAGQRVLDLCCGSGVAALHALRCGATEAVAVDLSQRACDVTKANAIINGFDSKIITYQGDLYSALVTAGKTARDFDLIVANPPFVAAPEDAKTSLYVHGGPDGLAITRQIFQAQFEERGSIVVIGEFPNLSHHLPPWLSNSPGWQYVAFFAEEHRQKAEVYATERAQPPQAKDVWWQSLVQVGVKDVTSALVVASFDSTRCSEASWETFVWPAQDADQSWTLVLDFWEETCSFWGTKVPLDTPLLPVLQLQWWERPFFPTSIMSMTSQNIYRSESVNQVTSTHYSHHFSYLKTSLDYQREVQSWWQI
ncbi:unnamed protein product [Cladocopium goreaui]|uniref:ETFB lysine methyltransferase (Protein N-lysine methyltransferase METTL20) n=1 Tax=Cladocopium goreaui TaxID=2562237 RepID=A0A9P1G8Y5_9DINO|nr:unnamed protein product [Cladocopium goreaui]